MTNIQDLIAKRQEIFIEQRSKLKQDVTAVLAKIKKLPANITEVWKEQINLDDYHKEREAFDKDYQLIKQRIDIINAKAYELLQETLKGVK